jgi:hypothetical protein
LIDLPVGGVVPAPEGGIFLFGLVQRQMRRQCNFNNNVRTPGYLP